MPIDFDKLTEKDIGRKVLYRGLPDGLPEEGVITSWSRHNIHIVFVRYGVGLASKATYAQDLDWLMPEPPPPSPIVDF